MKTEGGRDWREDVMVAKGIPGELAGTGSYKRGQSHSPLNNTKTRETVGWIPSCRCEFSGPVPCTVLDPFSGSGTTGYVAIRHGRNYVGLDLNSQYLPLATARILGYEPPTTEPSIQENSVLDLFE